MCFLCWDREAPNCEIMKSEKMRNMSKHDQNKNNNNDIKQSWCFVIVMTHNIRNPISRKLGHCRLHITPAATIETSNSKKTCKAFCLTHQTLNAAKKNQLWQTCSLTSEGACCVRLAISSAAETRACTWPLWPDRKSSAGKRKPAQGSLLLCWTRK